MLSTIGLIDRDIVVRLGIGIMIHRNMEAKLLEADNLTAFADLYTHTHFDLIIIGNYELPGSGYQHVKQLRSLFGNTPLIVYDENASAHLTTKYLELGVNGYLLRQTISEELIPCIREVVDGKRYLSTELLQHLLSSLQKRSQSAERLMRLTDHESQIADMLCKGMKTSLIADQLQRKSSTISTIKHNIFKKMGVTNVIELSHAIGRELAEAVY